MPGYSTRQLDILLGADTWHIRALSDLQQFSDPAQLAERAGISSALWSLFGQVWPSGRVLAEAMQDFDIDGKRILELGCGLGLSSLVLQRRQADITASDHHPLAESFLVQNALQNDLPPIAYCDLRWEIPDPALGRFDLIIGSDILYERGHAALLAQSIQRHAAARCEILISDPGRGNANDLSRLLLAQGYVVTEQRRRFEATENAPFRGRLLHYARAGVQ